MGVPAVILTDLCKAYSGRPALAELSATIAAGRVTALLGPNGAGKTTTVDLCLGHRRPDRGSARVLGLDPTRSPRALATRVGVMPQTPGGYVGARAGELLDLVAATYAHPLPRAALLERVGLADVARVPFRRLSGGQKQRLSLALAVVGRPELVFLDEPTAGLDVTARAELWGLVGELRDAGVTVVVTTHALDEAERLADDILILSGGRLVCGGGLEELRRGGGDGLSFRAPPGLPVSELRRRLPAGAVVSEAPAGTYRVGAAVDPAVVATVTAWCAGHGVFADDLRTGRRSLEEIYLTATGPVAAP